MSEDSRKENFLEAKLEEVILELEQLSSLCEEKSQNCNQLESQRFYEGMAIAYTTVAIKIKNDFDYIDPKVIDELFNALEKNSWPNGNNNTSYNNTLHREICSFCNKNKDDVGMLAMGPGVSICSGCLEFGAEVIKAQK